MSVVTKLSPDVTQYYKNITSPIGANARIQRIYNNEQYKMALMSLQKENSRDAQRGLEG